MSWKVITTLLLLVGYSNSGTNGKKKTYEGAKLFNVFHDGQLVLQELIKEAGLDVWYHNQTNTEFMVPYLQLKSVEYFLNSRCIDYSITITNVQELINEQQTANLPRSPIRAFSLRNYHRLDDIYDWMETLHKQYPEHVSVELVGYSYEKRPIKCLKVSSGVPGAKAAFIDGGMHAREWIAPATVLSIINELVNKRDKQADYIKETDFYLVPVANPDGYEYSHTTDRLWRKNRSKGDSQDWAKEKAGVKYSYTIELRDDGTYGFLLPAKHILPTAREAFVGVKVILQAASWEKKNV